MSSCGEERKGGYGDTTQPSQRQRKTKEVVWLVRGETSIVNSFHGTPYPVTEYNCQVALSGVEWSRVEWSGAEWSGVGCTVCYKNVRFAGGVGWSVPVHCVQIARDGGFFVYALPQAPLLPRGRSRQSRRPRRSGTS
jgi:hypothetical protein